MSCAESLRVQAYFDGELRSGEAGDVEEHLTQCMPCQGLLEDLERTRSTLRRSFAGEQASPGLRPRVMRALDAEEASPTRPRQPRAWHVRPFWIGALSGASGLAVALAGAFLLFTAASSNTVLGAVADAHLRSLSSRHLIDVVSSDRHTVKPWFAGRTDVSPPVADFAAQGYKLLGGRVENLGHERAAVLVYEHGAHLINVFSWSARGPLPAQAVRSGYHMVLWKSGDIESCAVSDAGWDELNALAGLIKGVSAGDAPH